MSVYIVIFQFQESSEAAQTGEYAPRRRSYPPEVFEIILSARHILPTVERTELMVAFYMEQLDWMAGLGDYDAMETWLIDFLVRIKQPDLQLEYLRQDDATRLALVVGCILSSVQIAGEGLVKVFFPDSEPMNSALVDPTRQSIKNTYEKHLRKLLDVALQYDGSTPDLIRSSLMYYFFLKNEGRYGEEGAVPFMQSISRLVRLANLHLDPPFTTSEVEAESRRRLFLSYYVYSRVTCITSGEGISISDREITTQEPQKEDYYSTALGKRSVLCQIYKARLFRRVEGFLNEMKRGVNEDAIRRYEIFLEGWRQSLPPMLHPTLPRLTSSYRTIRGFDLERHLLQATYYISRSTLNRSCFFPSDAVSMDQVHRSRQACIDSALGMIKIQESLRMRIVSDHHLRCLYVPLFTLESSITLALASLIELANPSPNRDAMDNVQDYMRWAYRGRDLLVTIPTDFTQGVQAVKLVSRVLSKATKIINLHALQLVPQTDDKSAIREILSGEDGERLCIPLLDVHYKRTDFDNIHKNAYKATGVIKVTEMTPLSNSSTSEFGSSPKIITPLDGIALTSIELAQGSPTYADLGMDFFNQLAAALQPVTHQPSLLPTTTTTTTSSSAIQPETHNQTLDEQMDIWLASLQTVS